VDSLDIQVTGGDGSAENTWCAIGALISGSRDLLPTTQCPSEAGVMTPRSIWPWLRSTASVRVVVVSGVLQGSRQSEAIHRQKQGVGT